MKPLRLDKIGELSLAAEWFTHPSACVWKEIIYPRILGNIMAGLRGATSEDSRAQLQGALITVSEIHEALSGAETALKSIQARAETQQTSEGRSNEHEI